jgi:Zn-dependent protease with chaperone function
MSPLRKIVPTGALEQQAAAQYAQTLNQAKQQNALAAENDPQLQRLRAIAKRIILLRYRGTRAKDWKWEVNLLGSKQVNAYCMPGGKIAFYTGILTTLRMTDDEIAMVMGHEIAHALREHGAERAGKATIANIFVKGAEIFAAAKGYDPNMAGQIAGGAAKVTMLNFSRDDEIEADIVGLDMLRVPDTTRVRVSCCGRKWVW